MEDVSEVVRKHILRWIEDGKGAEELDPNHGTVEIMAGHPDIEGADALFYIPPTRDAVRNEYHRQAKKFKNPRPDLEPDPQLTLEGFKRLQKAYLIDRMREYEVEYEDLTPQELKRERDAAYEPLKRNGKLFIVKRPTALLVKIEALTDMELYQKEREYREMASGCIEHANEISRYRIARRGVAA